MCKFFTSDDLLKKAYLQVCVTIVLTQLLVRDCYILYNNFILRLQCAYVKKTTHILFCYHTDTDKLLCSTHSVLCLTETLSLGNNLELINSFLLYHHKSNQWQVESQSGTKVQPSNLGFCYCTTILQDTKTSVRVLVVCGGEQLPQFFPRSLIPVATGATG